MQSVNIDLPGYRNLEQLYAGSRSLVCRAIREADQFPVVLKLLQAEYPTFEELVRFRNQYAIAQIAVPGVVKPLALLRYRQGFALVMEDVGGVSLANYLQAAADRDRTTPVSLADFFIIGLQVAETLAGLHRCRVIHKDLKPANILIQPDTKQVKLIDFSISSVLPRETQEIQNPNGLEGTLAYLSPEQTGRMNRGIDYRSDFYSLGVTFYELLTGQLPFVADDPMELVHCHIARAAVPVAQVNQTVPPVLSDIVAKLMAKNAEDRYQSALGLKHDLERCLAALTTGETAPFALGQQDRCDRFLIAEKLYGRESAVEELLNAFERVSMGTTEMMLVAGFSGIGKTAVVNEVHKPIVRQRGYFIKGKYDQFQRNIPFSAFVQAFRELLGQLLAESDPQLQSWKAQILEAVGENGQVLIDVIPELECIIGKQPPAPELSGSAAQNRFNLLMQKFVVVFTTADHPLVLFLDDLQWADSASLKLMELLMRDTGYLLAIGAYRDNEVSPVHPLMLTMDEIGKGATVQTITLQPLSLGDMNQLVADTLNCDRALAQPLTELVYKKTKGNPFFATQFLKSLHEDGQITFDWEVRHWQCDIAQVRALATTDDVVEFMALQLQKLPTQTQTMLKLAACIGTQFDLNTLAIVSEQSKEETAAALWKALQEGLIIPTTEIYKFFTQSDTTSVSHATANPRYRFLHDRVQQAAYSLIAEEQKQQIHLKTGRLLLRHTSAVEIEERIFEIVNQLNTGADLITQLSERYELAQLNLIAGRKAKAATAYATAAQYFTTGMAVSTSDRWESQYHLALALSESAAEATFLNADFDRMEHWANLVFQNAKTLLDTIKVYDLKVLVLIAQNKLLEAIELGLFVLKQLDIEFPVTPDSADVQVELAQTQADLANRQIEDLINLPEMTEPSKLAAIQILASLVTASYKAAPNLFSLIVFKQVQLSIAHGNTAASALAYSLYGLLLSLTLGDIDRGYQFGQLALRLVERPSAQAIRAKAIVLVNLFTQHRKHHAKETLEPSLRGYLSALEVGDIEYAAYCVYTYCLHSFLTGKELSELEQEMTLYAEVMLQLQQKQALSLHESYRQFVLVLLDHPERLFYLTNQDYNVESVLLLYLEANNLEAVFYLYLTQLMQCYLFGKTEQAVDCAARAEPYLAGGIPVAVFHFYSALARLTAFGSAQFDSELLMQKVTEHQEQLQIWAHHAPMNYLHKWHLVEAERHRVWGDKLEAINLYDRAIAGAKANDYLQEEALANELAAKFYLDWGKEKIAAAYMQEAYYCYAHWGAKAKTVDLERCYPQLLRPILNQPNPGFNLLETLTTFSRSSSSTQASTRNSLADALDFVSVLKAAQALSSSIQLEELIRILTQIVLENTGAETCVLLFPDQQEWQIRAVTHLESGSSSPTTHLQTTPLADSTIVPTGLIHYVKRTKEPALVDHLKTDIPGMMAEYLLEHQPQSVLCTPILNQGSLVGVLYLEHRSTKGVFTSDRLLVTNFLCTQAAISLENARLYQQSQQALADLQATQLQLVQSEKMSALGNLVAGVAHEINNPVGFISGNLHEAKRTIQDLIAHLNLYRDRAPQTDITNHAEEIDLEYLIEDLPQMIDSMQLGCDRIKGISTSLRTFSRADRNHQVTANLHEGIDSTILILKHRLKANESRPAIEVVTDYGDIPAIKCFPGQLNQVFMNILTNAIDALEDSNQGRSFTDIQAKPNQITVKTELSDDRQFVLIRLHDNGSGMSNDLKQKIFEHLFTTKGVGRGTGLGLAIARQIVVEHGGAIEVNSTLGKETEFVITLPVKGIVTSLLKIRN